jgi:TRAP transporter TAXI family solute receptor
VDDGSITLGVIASMDLYWAYSGTINYTQPRDTLRLIASGNWSEHCTMTVLADSGIETAHDIAGKRVGYVYGGNKLTVQLVDAGLKAVGLTIDDCVQVPLPDLNDALRALQERRVDVVFSGSTTTPASVELDQAIGLRVLPIGDLTPEDVETASAAYEEVKTILGEYVPGAEPRTAQAAGTLKVPTVLTTYPIQLCGTNFLTEGDVYAITKALYEHYEELADAHAWGRQWIPENFVIGNFTVPYHDGAVKFYKVAGIWTPVADAIQTALLSQ